MGVFLVILFAILMFLKVPIAVSMGLSSMLTLLIFGKYSTLAVTHQIISGIDSYILIAIPFFILAGELMNTGGITTRIFKFADLLVGRIPGGMAHTNIVASIIFSGMSGSAVADTGGLGLIELKAMKEHGFDDGFSAAVTCASATIGPIIPPSIPLIVFGAMAEVSIGKLFLGGFIPGVLLGLALMVLVYLISKRRAYPIRERLTSKEGWEILRRGILPILTPVIIIGGILTGVFTPTESAIIACAYAFLLGILYQEMSFRKLQGIFLNSLITSATILFIIAAAKSFSWLLAMEGIPQAVTSLILSITDNPFLIILLLNVILLGMGMFMEGLSILTIIVPFLTPLMQKIGLNPIHIGVMVVLNLMIGLSTPPVGMSLFVMNRISGVKLEVIYKEILPFLIPLLIVLIIIAVAPDFVLWLPNFCAK
jgi:tripartite ATP-independent transporter DctM subunit